MEIVSYLYLLNQQSLSLEQNHMWLVIKNTTMADIRLVCIHTFLLCLIVSISGGMANDTQQKQVTIIIIYITYQNTKL